MSNDSFSVQSYPQSPPPSLTPRTRKSPLQSRRSTVRLFDPLPTPATHRNIAHDNEASRTPALAAAAASLSSSSSSDPTTLIGRNDSSRTKPACRIHVRNRRGTARCAADLYGVIHVYFAWTNLTSACTHTPHRLVSPPHSLQSSPVIVTQSHPQSHPSTVDRLAWILLSSSPLSGICIRGRFAVHRCGSALEAGRGYGG
ncbi:hypothetical protein R3P38DRAFT_3219008 [Favolaschia claudopus]|uniref:Uncharacterized protein n=1 Tax=Favolaschia claudopus TaxID=2862362 RepID=A0AAW0A265_9AGAR